MQPLADHRTARPSLRKVSLVWVAPLAVLAAALFIFGCGSAQQSRLLGPGDADYPTANANPSEGIELTVTGLSAVDVHVLAVYRASWTAGGTMQSRTACARYISEAGAYPYALSIPVPLQSSDGTQRGRVAIDAYQPGRCRWPFAAIRYEVDGERDNGQSIVVFDGNPDLPTEAVADICCARDPDGPPHTNHRSCSVLPLLAPHFVSREFVASVPIDQQGLGTPVRLTYTARSLTVRGHDASAAPGRASPQQ